MSACCPFALAQCGFAVKGGASPWFERLAGICSVVRFVNRGRNVVLSPPASATIIIPRRRRKSLKVEPPDISGGSAYFICLGSSMIPNI